MQQIKMCILRFHLVYKTWIVLEWIIRDEEMKKSYA